MSRQGDIPGFNRLTISEELIGDDPDLRLASLTELNNQLDEIWNYLSMVVSAAGDADGGLAPAGENYVLYGSSTPSTLPSSRLHRNLTGADLHNPKAHKDRHKFGGSDAFVFPDDLDASARGLRETLGPTFLAMDEVEAGEFLRRGASTNIIEGALPVGGMVWSYADDDTSPKTAAALNTWYTWVEWGLHGTDDIGFTPNGVPSVLNVIAISAGTWEVRVQDVTAGVTIVDWTGKTAAGRFKESTDTGANWPSVGTNDIEIQYRQTAGTAGVDTIDLNIVHLMIAPGAQAAPLGGNIDLLRATLGM
jgi:hypothetical protein